MEDSLRGTLIAVFIIGIFSIAVINFVILFPQEQGVNFSDSNDYLQIQPLASTENLNSSLNNLSAHNLIGFNNLNLEIGYLGSNTQKSSKDASENFFTSVYNNFETLALLIFSDGEGNTNSPIVSVLYLFGSFIALILLLIFIQYLRQGR